MIEMTEILPFAPVERILKKNGASRVSPEAVKLMAETLEEIGVEIGQKAIELSKFAKRNTVTGEDVKLALQ